MIEADEIGQLVTFIQGKSYSRIGVDGTNGSGKTTVAEKLAKTLGLRHLNLDDYLNKKEGGFLDFLHYADIKHELTDLDGFIIDGVCLLDVLDRVNQTLDCLIYVKRMRHGLWADESECNVEGNVEEFILKEKETVCLIEGNEGIPETLGLAEEIIRYHDIYLPQNKADIFYLRNEII